MRLETPRQRRRRKAREAPFPPAWRALLSGSVVQWRYLDAAERARLEDLIKVFLVDKEFEGAGGMRVTDEVRVNIAAQACLLVLGLDDPRYYYRDVHSIIVYPSSVRPTGPQPSPLLDGAVTAAPAPLAGQARLHGPMVIVWDQAAAQARFPGTGRNVVHHEFAHKIDMADGAVDGSPRHRDLSAGRHLDEVLAREFARLRRRSEEGEPTLLDSYGGQSAVEFFAVATEAFFDVPVPLQEQCPELYGALAGFYGQDPAARVRRGAAEG
ncbi:MAG: zinc-dependent peptidase [Actinobacteria bacterium]|nr:zinc-dependent peptidase [Actinomycetota bacterium]